MNAAIVATMHLNEGFHSFGFKKAIRAELLNLLDLAGKGICNQRQVGLCCFVQKSKLLEELINSLI